MCQLCWYAEKYKYFCNQFVVSRDISRQREWANEQRFQQKGEADVGTSGKNARISTFIQRAIWYGGIAEISSWKKKLRCFDRSEPSGNLNDLIDEGRRAVRTKNSRRKRDALFASPVISQRRVALDSVLPKVARQAGWKQPMAWPACWRKINKIIHMPRR